MFSGLRGALKALKALKMLSFRGRSKLTTYSSGVASRRPGLKRPNKGGAWQSRHLARPTLDRPSD